MALPGIIFFPFVARSFGALQADGHRPSLGVASPAADHCHWHGLFQQIDRPVVGHPPLSGFNLCRPAAVAIFASAMAEASNILIVNSNMISKIYFPRLIIPASAVIVSFSDLLISLVILVGLMLWYHVMPTWRLMALPLFTLLAFA